jgi:hypothetical protein
MQKKFFTKCFNLRAFSAHSAAAAGGGDFFPGRAGREML